VANQGYLFANESNDTQTIKRLINRGTLAPHFTYCEQEPSYPTAANSVVIFESKDNDAYIFSNDLLAQKVIEGFSCAQNKNLIISLKKYDALFQKDVNYPDTILKKPTFEGSESILTDTLKNYAKAQNNNHLTDDIYDRIKPYGLFLSTCVVLFFLTKIEDDFAVIAFETLVKRFSIYVPMPKGAKGIKNVFMIALQSLYKTKIIIAPSTPALPSVNNLQPIS